MAFIERHNVYRVAMTDQIYGCPHEEGIEYPGGEVVSNALTGLGEIAGREILSSDSCDL